jgi:hypothetical protein
MKRYKLTLMDAESLILGEVYFESNDLSDAIEHTLHAVQWPDGTAQINIELEGE